jgi:hypothetical protein
MVVWSELLMVEQRVDGGAPDAVVPLDGAIEVRHLRREKMH